MLLVAIAMVAVLLSLAGRPAGPVTVFTHWLLWIGIAGLTVTLYILWHIQKGIPELKEAEEEISKIHLRYQALAEISPVGIFYTDAAGFTTYVNPKWREISGLPRKQALGNGWLVAVHPDDREALFAGWNEAARNQELSIAEYRFVRPDGSIRWVMGQAIPEKNPEGQIVGYVGNITDITARKKAEEKLKQSHRQLELSQSIAHVGYWERDLVNEDNYWSDEMYRLFGLKNTGRPEDLEIFMQKVHPEDRHELGRIRESIIENGKATTTEFRYIMDNGEIKHFMTRGYVVHDESGRPIRMEGITQDITTRKRIEDEILKEKQLSDSLIKTLPNAFYLYTREGQFLRWNRHFEEASGYSAEEISRMRPTDFFDEEDKALIAQRIDNVFAYGEETVEAPFYTKNKKKIPYYFTGKAIEYEGRLCAVGVGLDISKRVEAQEKIRQSSEQLRQLAAHLQDVREEERADMAREIHDELGQQLTGLKMDVYWLKEEMESPAAETLQQIDGILRLLDQTIFTVRKISAALRPPILDDLGLVEALKQYGRDFQKRFGVELIFETELPDLPVLPKQGIGLFRIFQESLTNVARHAEASRVVCSLELVDDNIVLRIADNGKGFDMAKTARKKTLGLLGMQERILVMEGTCAIKSAPGAGTEVVVTVPLQPVAA
ncbi:MAG: PAS domain S-box protein [Bacteroidetes bacterium]|nr:PAS domain S-box protein [Bacteroidota bacterium]